MVPGYIVSCFCVGVLLTVDYATTAAIQGDITEKKPQQEGSQLNDWTLYSSNHNPTSMRRYRKESPWGSVVPWPHELHRAIRASSSQSNSAERHYNSYYHGKFITNGEYNHLYNGPHLDDNYGFGNSGNRPPSILPPPISSFGR